MKKNLESNSHKQEQRSMVDFYDTMFPVSAQAEMLSLNRSSLYCKPRPSSEWDLQLNRLIDITYTKHPEFAHRRIAAWLAAYYGFQWIGIPCWHACRIWAFKLFIQGRIPASSNQEIRSTHIF